MPHSTRAVRHILVGYNLDDAGQEALSQAEERALAAAHGSRADLVVVGKRATGTRSSRGTVEQIALFSPASVLAVPLDPGP